MKTKIMKSSKLLFMLGFLASYAMAQDESHMELDIPPVLVHGFPAPLSFTFQNGGGYPVSMPAFDFATSLWGNTMTGLAVVFKGSNAATRVGMGGYGSIEAFGLAGDVETWSIDKGAMGTLSFDLSQVLMAPPPNAGKDGLPRPGHYEVSVMFDEIKGNPPSRDVTVREPTPDEKRFVDAMADQGIWRQWFPSVVLRDDLVIPDDIPLTEDTAPIRDFIKLLRLAFRDPSAAVDWIDARKDPWGRLQGMVSELRYECLVKAEGADSEAAKTQRRALESDLSTRGRLARLDSVGGILDHLESMKASEKWHLVADRNMQLYYFSKNFEARLDIPSVLVDGFPVPLSVTFYCNQRTAVERTIPALDFATNPDGNSTSGFDVEFKSTNSVWSAHLDGRREAGSRAPGARTLSMKMRPRHTISFDLMQVLPGLDGNAVDRLPLGQHAVSIRDATRERISPPVAVTVRVPTPDERRFINASADLGIRRQWFPDVVVREDLVVPEDIPLTEDTAPIRDFIKLLRLAFRDPGAAVARIDGRKESWGVLDDMVLELKYECLVKTQGRESKSAVALYSMLMGKARTSGRISRMDQIGGVLNHFEALGAAREKR